MQGKPPFMSNIVQGLHAAAASPDLHHEQKRIHDAGASGTRCMITATTWHAQHDQRQRLPYFCASGGYLINLLQEPMLSTNDDLCQDTLCVNWIGWSRHRDVLYTICNDPHETCTKAHKPVSMQGQKASISSLADVIPQVIALWN